MGNRAYIKLQHMDSGIYLHWNGGPDSVTAFLRYCELSGFRCDDTGMARLCQVTANWFPDGLSVALMEGPFAHYSNPGDNGIYEIRDWKIVRHMDKDGNVQERDEDIRRWMEENSEGYDIEKMLHDINLSMPWRFRLKS